MNNILKNTLNTNRNLQNIHNIFQYNSEVVKKKLV